VNFDDISQTWQSPNNRPTKAQLEDMKMNMESELRRRRRSNLGLLVISLCPLLFFTAKIVLHLVWPQPDHTPVDLSREWAVLPFFALPWIGWLVLAALQRTHSAQHHSYNASIAATVTALLDENRHQQTRHKLVCVLLALSVPALGLVVYQLRSVGKVGNEIIIPACVIYPLYVLGMVLWLRWHHVNRTVPRQRELESLLHDYNQPSHG
jgi:hypothetical protein